MLAVLGVAGCGSESADIGTNTGCGRFLRMSTADQERAVRSMQQDRGKGTSQNEITRARDTARVHCQPGDLAGAINDIYDARGEGATGGQAAASFVAAHSYTAEGATADGTTADLRIEFGELVRARDLTLLAGFPDPATSCTLDRERDALIPGRLVATNTTDGFTATVPLGFKLLAGQGVGVESSSEFSTGPTCDAPQSESDDVVDVLFSDVAPGSSRQHEFYLVLHGYYSPGRPEGNEVWLSSAIGDFAVDSVQSPGWSISCVTDAGGVEGASVSKGAFTLAGSNAEDALSELRSVSPRIDLVRGIRSGDQPAC